MADAPARALLCLGIALRPGQRDHALGAEVAVDRFGFALQAQGADAGRVLDLARDVVGVLGWNDAPVQRGRGSAIFLHVARADLAPTEGCVALPEADLRRLLAAGLGMLEIVA